MLRSSLLIAAGGALALLGVGLGAAYAFGGTASRYGLSRPCGAVVWSTSTLSTKSFFEAFPHTQTSSVLLVRGAPVETDVRQVRCEPLAARAAVVPDATPDVVRVYDTKDGSLLSMISFEAPIVSTAWSRGGRRLAALSEPRDGVASLSVVSPEDDAAPRVVRSDARLGSGYTWSMSDELCWVLADRGADATGGVEVECETDAGGVRVVARGTRARAGPFAPWVGFLGPAVHLCGVGLAPRDLECVGLQRTDVD